jgi:hypothetical protein
MTVIERHRLKQGWLGLVRRYNPHKPVATTANRLNARTCRSTLIQHSTKRRDLDWQIAFLDGHVRPDGGKNLLFGNEFTPSCNQQRENVEGSRPKGNWDEPILVIAKQPATVGIETVVLEHEDARGGRRRQA